MTRPVSGRDVAARVVARVAKDGAFAAAALDAELANAVQLQDRDRAYSRTELVYGSLRVQPWLLEEIGRFTPRGVPSIEAAVRAHLLVAAYQLFFTRVPAFAAVNETVAAVKALCRGPRVGAFANAVLRKVATRAESLGDEERSLAVVASTPSWLRESLEKALGPAGATAFLAASAEPPAVALRVEDAGARDRWMEAIHLAAPGATVTPGRVSARAILVRGAGRPQSLPGWDEGAWTVQEEGSQLAALAVGARPGETVLDACAGRGNKTGVLARAVLPGGAVDACDSSPAKLARLVEELARLGLRARQTLAVDWTVGSGEVSASYDRVLVDAPCTGVGTLRRRPEITLRREPADLAAKSREQIAITSRAASHVRPGGVRLVYVVCSVLREEAEGSSSRRCGRAPPISSPRRSTPRRSAPLAGDASSLRLLPRRPRHRRLLPRDAAPSRLIAAIDEGAIAFAHHPRENRASCSIDVTSSPARRERLRGNGLQVARPGGGRREEGSAARPPSQTDKADSELPSPAAGRVARLLAAEGDVVAGEGRAPAQIDDSTALSAAPGPPVSIAPASRAPLATPTVRKTALEHDVDLSAVQGTGERGRVTRDDVMRAAGAPASNDHAVPLPSPRRPPSRPVPHRAPAAVRARACSSRSSSTRAAGSSRPSRASASARSKSPPIGRRRATGSSPSRGAAGSRPDHMTYSKFASPHVVTVAEVDLHKASKLRDAHKERYKAEGLSLTMLAFVVVATAHALREHIASTPASSTTRTSSSPAFTWGS